jgi:hypothetical protein
VSKVVKIHKIDEIVISTSSISPERLADLLDRRKPLGVSVKGVDVSYTIEPFAKGRL